MTYNPPTQMPEWEIASRNYWATRTGRECPPLPTYRLVNGKERFGRYMDPYGCQAYMDAAKKRWQSQYRQMYATGFAGLIFAPVNLCITALLAVVYFLCRSQPKKEYMVYKATQDRILATGEPQWVPYDKGRLNMIKHNPNAIRP